MAMYEEHHAIRLVKDLSGVQDELGKSISLANKSSYQVDQKAN